MTKCVKLLSWLTVFALLLVACAPVRPTTPSSVGSSAPSASTAGYPVTIENCGNTLTFDKAPERVVTLYPPTTEIMLALDLAEHIIGIGSAESGGILPEYEGAYKVLPVLSAAEGGTPKELLISAQPDFVFDNQPDYFYDASQGFATREELAANGAQIYSLTAKCKGSSPEASVESVDTDLTNLGQIFGVSERAQTQIAKM
jgi:iron complex transport system substrate-binding protein